VGIQEANPRLIFVTSVTSRNGGSKLYACAREVCGVYLARIYYRPPLYTGDTGDSIASDEQFDRNIIDLLAFFKKIEADGCARSTR
jgi:hypothetical protein